ncbi:hypothetical protein [Rhizosaccharibacter radicis]|uniref:hypothetical protein n=1 Tax=Rhizosaccharibacter radicis TaxID=2782605 RepID=UPI003BF6006E
MFCSEAAGAEVVIASNGSRRHLSALNRVGYRRRNVIERMFCRMKDWRCIATRSDGLARHCLSAIAIIATARYRLA